jgi:hypothetical protein
VSAAKLIHQIGEVRLGAIEEVIGVIEVPHAGRVGIGSGLAGLRVALDPLLVDVVGDREQPLHSGRLKNTRNDQIAFVLPLFPPDAHHDALLLRSRIAMLYQYSTWDREGMDAVREGMPV